MISSRVCFRLEPQFLRFEREGEREHATQYKNGSTSKRQQKATPPKLKVLTSGNKLNYATKMVVKRQQERQLLCGKEWRLLFKLA